MIKKFLSTFLLLCMFTFSSQAQNCITVNWAYFDNPTGDAIHWRLLINWSADGVKHLRTLVTNFGDTVLNECLQVSNGGGGTQTGTTTYTVTVPDGRVDFKGTFRRFTGTCGNGSECGGTQSLINNVLPIKATNISARNIGNNTEVRFTIETVEYDDNIVRLSMVLKNGSKREYNIKMPDGVMPGQNWKIIINNLTNTYTLIKL